MALSQVFNTWSFLGDTSYSSYNKWQYKKKIQDKGTPTKEEFKSFKIVPWISV